jgi:hypothetical protein
MVEVYMTQYITVEDLPIINAALEKGEVVRIRHTDKGGTKITKEMSKLLKAKRVEEQLKK